MKVLAVLSGGMDSTVAMHWARYELFEIVGGLSFNYGSKHNDREYLSAQAQCDILKIPSIRIDLTEIGKHLKSDLLKSGGDIPEGHYADPSMKRTVVPFRNGIMLSIAAGVAESMEAEAIVLGNHFGDHAIYPDCRTDFIVPMGQAIKAGTYAEITLMSPFQRMSKTQIAEMGFRLAVDFSKTYSCYNGREKHCGKCGTCFERKEAFRDSGVADPTEYEA